MSANHVTLPSLTASASCQVSGSSCPFCVPAVQHVLQPGRGEGRHWQAVPWWPPRWHLLLLHPGGVLLQLHDSRQRSSCTLHGGNMYPSCIQCSWEEYRFKVEEAAFTLLSAYFITHKHTPSLYTNNLPDSVCMLKPLLPICCLLLRQMCSDRTGVW